MDARAPRLVAAAGCLLVAGWCALGALQASALERAQEIVAEGGRPTAAQAQDALALLDRAGWLNPGGEPDLVRAQLAFERDQDARAQALLEALVRREPDNIAAWDRLAAVTLDADPQTWARATAQIRRLSPPVPDP